MSYRGSGSSPRLRAELASVEPSVIDVALVFAVDSAVADRSRVMHTPIRPALLAEFVAETLRSCWTDPTARPGTTRIAVADGYRWQKVVDQLLAELSPGELSAASQARSDFDIATLERFIGEPIRGASLFEWCQYAFDRRDREAARADVGAVLLGDADPAPLTRIGECDSASSPWVEAIEWAAKRWLEGADWATEVLTFDTVEPEEMSGE